VARVTAIDLDTLTLAKGAHGDREQGVCLLEAVAWFAGQDHTDRPPCVSPVLGVFGRALNDALPDGKRQELIPLIPLLPGTAGDGRDQARGYLALDWLIRVHLPAWLELADLPATALRDLPPIADLAAAAATGPVVRQAAERAAAAWAAAGAVAEAAAWAVARAVARAAAWDAAWAAVWAAARAAAGDALAPTAAVLQDSAIGLYRAMVTAGGVA